MINRLKKIVAGLYAGRTGSARQLKTYRLLGTSVKAFPGTTREAPDQDDAWFAWLAGHRKRLFDVGANVGLTALIAALRGMERILLVDPNPEALSRAAVNLIYNNLAGACGFETAFVGDRAGETIPFYTVGAGAAGSMYKGHAQTAAASGSVMQVPTTTVDALAERQGWAPDFIKIDVEGAEAKVLEGAVRTVQSAQPWLMVEMHSPPELPMIENARRVLDWCGHVAYQPWYMKAATPLESPEMIARRGKCHLLLLPSGTAYPAELAAIPQRAPLPDK